MSLFKKVLSIDIGIINFGYVFAELSENVNVIECNRVNIMNMRHNKVNRCDCTLHHEYCIPDYLDHFIQEHQELFNVADIILVERQPPMGLVNIMDLLFTKFRDKVKLINPGSIHKFFKMTKCDYELRKIESQIIANEYLNTFVNFQNNERKHDISDAMLMILFYFHSLKNVKKIKKINDIICNDFEQFRFIKV